MPIVQRWLIDQKRLATGVRKAERALAPDVKRIMYSIENDWTGELSVFFRIVLSDQASAPSRLREITQRVSQTIDNLIKAHESGLMTYFNFRSKSEHDEMKDPDWEG